MSRSRAARTAAFTLVELLLAMGLFTVLMLALLRLVDTSMTIWGRTDEGRELLEMSGSTLDLVSEDVHALEGGPRGDLLADWRLFDLDRDGIEGAPYQRLRLVRHVGAADLQRLAPRAAGSSFEVFERGLVEVVWALLPNQTDEPDERALGILVRGERLLGNDNLSVFDQGFFGPAGKPVPSSVNEVTGGVLWFDVWFATQTTILHGGWSLGPDQKDCSASWDAWRKQRPNPEISPFNLEPEGMPLAKDVPLLPRRVRVEIELERPRDLRNRTRLAEAANIEDSALIVRDGARIPEDRMILVGDEWMKVLGINGNRVSVQRAQRATRATVHAADALVHHGWRVVREIPVDMTREDWDL